MHCGSTKEIWDKLQNIYEGNDNLKKEKLQTLRRQFEILKMKDEENVAAYFLRVGEIVNTIRGLGEKVEEPIIVQNVLRYPPLRFDVKVSSIEVMKDLEKLTMDELHGILTTYEMTIEKEKSKQKEATLKASKKRKGHKFCDYSSHESHIKEVQFVRNLRKGSRKHRGKLPFICFNTGRVGNFVAKCPYEKREDSDDEDNNVKEEHDNRSKPYRHKRGKYTKKKSFYSIEYSSSSKESDAYVYDIDKE
jgi:hypothetical protein